MIPIPIHTVRLLQFQVTLCTFLSVTLNGSILGVPIYFLCSKIPEGIEIKGNESTALSDDVTTQCYLELQTGKFSIELSRIKSDIFLIKPEKSTIGDG